MKTKQNIQQKFNDVVSHQQYLESSLNKRIVSERCDLYNKYIFVLCNTYKKKIATFQAITLTKDALDKITVSEATSSTVRGLENKTMELKYKEQHQKTTN